MRNQDWKVSGKLHTEKEREGEEREHRDNSGIASSRPRPRGYTSLHTIELYPSPHTTSNTARGTEVCMLYVCQYNASHHQR